MRNLFYGDYVKDEIASMNAGYDIYMGTLGGWISDLGNRLEMVDGKTFKSTNIWIRPKDKQTFIVIAGKKTQWETLGDAVQYARIIADTSAGVDGIPQQWIDALPQDIKARLDAFAEWLTK